MRSDGVSVMSYLWAWEIFRWELGRSSNVRAEISLFPHSISGGLSGSVIVELIDLILGSVEANRVPEAGDLGYHCRIEGFQLG